MAIVIASTLSLHHNMYSNKKKIKSKNYDQIQFTINIILKNEHEH